MDKIELCFVVFLTALFTVMVTLMVVNKTYGLDDQQEALDHCNLHVSGYGHCEMRVATIYKGTNVPVKPNLQGKPL